VLLVETTEDFFADMITNHVDISQLWPNSFEDVRSAAPTPYSINRVCKSIMRRWLKLIANPKVTPHKLDAFVLRNGARLIAWPRGDIYKARQVSILK
jgi:hypothetical protein